MQVRTKIMLLRDLVACMHCVSDVSVSEIYVRGLVVCINCLRDPITWIDCVVDLATCKRT